jgi:hypothetical protein
MSLLTCPNDAWEDIDALECPEVDGAREEADSAYAYVDGAWEEVWGSGIEPIGLYIYSATYNSASIAGDDIEMSALYANRANSWARIAIPVDAEVTEVSIDSITIVGIDGTNYSVGLGVYVSDKLYTGAFTSDDSKTYLGAVYTGTSTDSYGENDYLLETSTSGAYLYLHFSLTRGTYNSAYSGQYVKLYISGLRVNGKKVVGNMVAS